MCTRSLRPWGCLGLMIVLTISLPHRLAASTPQDLGNLLPPGRQVPPQVPPQDTRESLPAPGTGSTLDREILLIEDRFAGWQQAGLGQKVERLDEKLRAHWVMVDDNGLLTGRVLLDPSALQAAWSAVANSNQPIPQPVGGAGPWGMPNQVGPSGGNWQYPNPSGAASGPFNPAGQNVAYYRNPENPNADRTPMQVFLLNRGKMISMSEIDQEGRFEFRGIKPGSYSLVGYGRAGFFAFGVNILGFAENAQVPQEILATPIADYGPAITRWVQRASPVVHFRIRGQHRFGEGRDDPPRLYGLAGLQTFLPEAMPATSIGGQPTAITADGRLLGRLHYIISFDGRPADLQATTVQLTQNGQVLQQSSTDNYGVFEFRNVTPGSYGIQAVGPDGLAALQVTVAEQANEQTAPIDIALLDDTSTGFLAHFMGETAYWSALSPPNPDDGQKPDCGCDDQGYGGGHGSGCPLLDWMHPYAP